MERRNFLTVAGAFLAAPAIIRTPGLLMPIKPYRLINRWDWYEPPMQRRLAEEFAFLEDMSRQMVMSVSAFFNSGVTNPILTPPSASAHRPPGYK